MRWRVDADRLMLLHARPEVVEQQLSEGDCVVIASNRRN